MKACRPQWRVSKIILCQLPFTSLQHARLILATRYALARHLRQNETIHPLVELGKFRGESVYSRSAVTPLKASENWMRSGRKIREGCQAMKWVKQRASTVNRRREIEMTLEREREERERAGQSNSGVGEEEVLQGLYAESQTELYVPQPITNVSCMFLWSVYECSMFQFRRAKYRRMILEISISTYRRCCPRVLFMYRVSSISCSVRISALK